MATPRKRTGCLGTPGPGKEIEFAETDWHKISDGYEITIANSEHGVNNPSTEFQMNNGAYWSVVLVETGTDHDGNVIIRADRRFAGRCLVK